MTSFQVRQIKNRLKADFEPLIDLSDVSHHAEDQLDRFRTTRALAAMVACSLEGGSAEEAAAKVTDESGDQGIDAVVTDQIGSTFYLIQSKTSLGAPSPGEIHKFHQGIRYFIDGEWDQFGPKIRNRSDEFEQLIEDGADHFVAIYAFLGDQPVKEGDEAWKLSTDFRKEVNLNGEILETKFWNTRDIYEKRNAASAPDTLEQEIFFEKWTAPFTSFKAEILGVVPASEIYQMVESCGDRLFDKNIRKALGNTQVNTDMAQTMVSDSNRFWHYNNGVTIVAGEIDANALNPRGSHTFKLKNLSVVNGAQTCSTIHSVGKQNTDDLEGGYVTVKVVSLAEQNEDFEHLVTRFTNTQNKVGGKEFAALDPRQQEIQDALKPEGIYYAFRTGDVPDPAFSESFTITEATQALAVAKSVSQATRAKSNLGSFWADIDAAPYTDLFNQRTDPAVVWNSVKLWRQAKIFNEEVASTLESSRQQKIVRNAVYLFGALMFRRAYATKFDLRDFEKNAEDWFQEERGYWQELTDAILEGHENINAAGYPANFFKNAKKVEELAGGVARRVN